MIPRILHRSVPATTAATTEQRWARAVELHHDWSHLTWRDPLDPDLFPLTAPHWHRCVAGAQLAGLVRLELLCTHGGIWLDSDVDLYRPLDPLLGCPAFAAWEDADCVPDAVLGAAPNHPAMRACLELAIRRINSDVTDWRTGRGPWATGPGVTTTVLPGRSDVLLLPPGSFYPVHYRDKDRTEWSVVEVSQPWAFGAHCWDASWL